MNNSKRNVHTSGALGLLIKNGQVSKVEEKKQENNVEPDEKQGIDNTFFRTQAGIEFKENEFIVVNPKECEPWEYANRLETEMGNIDELIESIKQNGQMQPVLIKTHSNPHDGIKYEIVFGRRRHFASLKLGINLLAIKKECTNIQDAIAWQDAENKHRNDVSPYSNAMLYKKLIKDNVFSSEREVAAKLNIPYSNFSDLMSFSRIPKDIVELIPNIHTISISMALKIVSIIGKSPSKYQQLLQIAPQIGKTITSPPKLEKALDEDSIKNNKVIEKPQLIRSAEGKKLFTLKTDFRGNHCILLDKELAARIDLQQLIKMFKKHLETFICEEVN